MLNAESYEEQTLVVGRLTPHELRIASLVADGQTNAEIAGGFCVTRRTVEFHLTNIYRKLGITRRGQLARELHRHGMVHWMPSAEE
jgi:DNA-binding CsgD family transcriptional regulator